MAGPARREFLRALGTVQLRALVQPMERIASSSPRVIAAHASTRPGSLLRGAVDVYRSPLAHCVDAGRCKVRTVSADASSHLPERFREGSSLRGSTDLVALMRS